MAEEAICCPEEIVSFIYLNNVSISVLGHKPLPAFRAVDFKKDKPLPKTCLKSLLLIFNVKQILETLMLPKQEGDVVVYTLWS